MYMYNKKNYKLQYVLSRLILSYLRHYLVLKTIIIKPYEIHFAPQI